MRLEPVQHDSVEILGEPANMGVALLGEWREIREAVRSGEVTQALLDRLRAWTRRSERYLEAGSSD